MTRPPESLANPRLWLAFTTMLLISGFPNSFVLFLPPLLAEFQASRATTASPMSFGFVITLTVEADKVRSVNRFMEQKAWGAFRYQVFPSYDFAPIAADLKKQHA